MVPEGGDDDGIGSVGLGDVPAEFGAEIVQEVGACPEIYEFAGGFDEFLDGGEGEAEEVGLGVECAGEGGDGAGVAVPGAVGEDGVGGVEEIGGVGLGEEFGVEAPEPPECLFCGFGGFVGDRGVLFDCLANGLDGCLDVVEGVLGGCGEGVS